MVRLSANERLDRMFWTYGFRGRPARALTEVLAELIDASSVGGGTFDLGSAAFDSMCVVTGQLDAYVEPGPRMVADVPGMREEFERWERRVSKPPMSHRRRGGGGGGDRPTRTEPILGSGKSSRCRSSPAPTRSRLILEEVDRVVALG